MLEISSILLSIVSIIIIFSFPFNCYNSKNAIFKYQLNFFDIILLNIILNLNVLLLVSFFSINLNILFIIYIFAGSLFFFYNFRKYGDFFTKTFFFISFFFINIILFVCYYCSKRNINMGWSSTLVF